MPVDDGLLEALQGDFRGTTIQQNVHVGKLATTASFYSKMVDFQKERHQPPNYYIAIAFNFLDLTIGNCF